METNATVLIISTSADRMDNGEPTGLWLSELTTPYYAMKDAGLTVHIASVKGGAIPIDTRSTADEDKELSVERYRHDNRLQSALAGSLALEKVDVESYDAMFFPGGHGAMFDYPENETIGAHVGKFLADGKPVVSVCHGPAALVGAKDGQGRPVVAGRAIAGFSNSEETAAGLDKAVPFLLESRLLELGASYRSGKDFTPFAVQDGPLITGQNPQSADLVVKLLIAQLRKPDATRPLTVSDGNHERASA